jgi:hypothetical protein
MHKRVNPSNIDFCEPERRTTPLYVAAKSGHLELCVFLNRGHTSDIENLD